MSFAIYPSLKGRVVFVSGGATGIGADIVSAFARQQARVAFVDVQGEAGEALARTLGGAALFIPADVTDIEALRAAIAQTREKLGLIGALVNNAANDVRHDVADVTPEFWDQSQNINLRHHFFAAQAAHPQMKALGGGSIINLSSIAWRIGAGEMPAYAAAKAGVTGLTRALARAFGPDNIRVNAIEPGAVMTERQRALWYKTQASVDAMAQKQMIRETLLGEEIARAALFLAADDSRMITKQSLTVDAGAAMNDQNKACVFGLNPYGLTYHLGLQGAGTPRANPRGRGLEGFLSLGAELGAKAMELFDPWLRAMSDAELAALKQRLDAAGVTPIVSWGLMMGPFESALRSARALGATTIRCGLTTVLCGDRGALGDKWPELVASVGAALADYGPRVADHGMTLAIENHQDFGSDELVAFCEANRGVGICVDAGNTFPVLEAPLDFYARVAPWVRHVHLKDYRVQFTDEGYRLVRCAIGDGAVPIEAMLELFLAHRPQLTAVLEPGALEARHVRFLRPEWWRFYPAKTAEAMARCLAAARINRLPDGADVRTPWERREDGALEDYELSMIRRSAANMRALGL